MARQTPLPRFRLDTDSSTEHNFTDERAASASPHMSQLHDQQQPPQLQTQRSQTRIRRSACSDLQSTAIPEERVYNGNRRRASLFIGRPSQQIVDIPKISLCDQEPAECDYVKLCRLRCQSLYGSLANPTVTSMPVSPLALAGDSFTVVSDDDDDDDDDNDNEDDEQDEEEQCFQTVPTNNFRHSLPDTSPTGLKIRNFLKRNKTTNCHHHHHNHRLGLPIHSSHSLCSSTSSSSSILTNSSSPLSTFRNFLSLVKLPSSPSSTKSITSTTSSSVSTTSHHSSLTTLTSAAGGSSTTLDQTTSSISAKKRPTTSIDTQYQWHFEVSNHTQ
jgi:hypothetical protein